MHWFTGFMLYVIVWWTVLFAVLPFGVRPVVDAGEVPGGWRGAPDRPQLGRKLLATTLIAAVLWGGCMLVITSGWISFRGGWLALPDT